MFFRPACSGPSGEDMPRKPLDGCKATRPPVHHPLRAWALDSQLHIPTAWVSPLSLRLLLIRPPHGVSECLYALIPPPLMRSPQTSG